MTRDEHEDAARETVNDARRKIRDEFQARHPKYVPPPWAGTKPWENFVLTNVIMYGWDGFAARGLQLTIPKNLWREIQKNYQFDPGWGTGDGTMGFGKAHGWGDP